MLARWQPLRCTSALNRVASMPFRWSLNPYRGCAHGCVYCYARVTHTYLGLGAGADFSTVLFAKTNVVQVLEAELARPSWRRELVALGTATDVYQPLEGQLRLTRGCLEVLARYRTPVSVVTKGPMVRRDTDVLQELGRAAGCTVALSIPTVDERLWRLTEPGTPAPRHRLLAVAHLARAGVRVGVLLAPLLPGLTDDRRHLEAAVRAAAEHGAAFVDAQVVYLRPEVRAHYLEFLGRHFPHLVRFYEAAYRAVFPPAGLSAAVEARVGRLRTRFGVPERTVETAPRPRAVPLWGNGPAPL
jgi:DNA repair photolyase